MSKHTSEIDAAAKALSDAAWGAPPSVFWACAEYNRTDGANALAAFRRGDADEATTVQKLQSLLEKVAAIAASASFKR